MPKLELKGKRRAIVLDSDKDRKPRPELNLTGQRRLQVQNQKAAKFLEADPVKFREWLEKAWAQERHNLLVAKHKHKQRGTNEQQDN